VAVQAFLDGRITWAAIADVVTATLDGYEVSGSGERTVDDVLGADATARRLATSVVAERSDR